MALLLVFSGCGEDEDERTGATQKITDTTAPTGSIYINSTAAPNNTNSNSVTLYISASDDYSGVSQMCVSDSTTCTTWETFTTSKAWTLPAGDGTKTVYVWFKDALGNANATPYSGTITRDTTPPTDGALSATAVSGTIKLGWSGFSDNGSGIKDYILVYNIGGSAPASCSAGTAVTNFTYTLSGGAYTFTQTTGLTLGTTT
ncbi:MAG: hypothetical protein Q7T53_12435, partial [Deltaproteobacteria bacterium]|nr:hypothetical protein [Deltaproteobacteria bacterium]